MEVVTPGDEVMTLSPHDALPAGCGNSADNGLRPSGGPEVRNHLGGATSDWALAMDTTDIDEATEVIRSAFFPVDIAPCGADSLRIRVKAEQLPLMSIGYLNMGGEAMLRAADLPGYQVAVAVSGRSVTKWPDRHPPTITAPGSATVFMPGADVDHRWSEDCGQLGIMFAAAEVVRQLEMLIDRPVQRPVEFARRLDLTSKASLSWLSLVSVLTREVGRDDGLLRHRLAVANFQHLLVEVLLLTQPHTYTDALNADGRPASPAVVKQAIDLMRAHPELVWTTAEVARATGVSARVLQKAFAQAGEPPPMTYLRQLRLNRVRAELADAAQTQSPAAVTAVAGRWGFVHLGRFAQQYRQLFGEAPSHTLRSSDR